MSKYKKMREYSHEESVKLVIRNTFKKKNSYLTVKEII